MRECFVLYCIVAKMFHVKHFDDDTEKMFLHLLVKIFLIRKRFCLTKNSTHFYSLGMFHVKHVHERNVGEFCDLIYAKIIVLQKAF